MQFSATKRLLMLHWCVIFEQYNIFTIKYIIFTSYSLILHNKRPK